LSVSQKIEPFVPLAVRASFCGGSRVIYYWAVGEDQLLMLLIYAKSEQDDLTPNQLKVLRKIVEEEYQ